MGDTRFHDIKGREVFDVGTWNGFTYTDEDLDMMVANFDALSAMGYAFPIKISHDPDQRLIANSELPAAGYIARLYRSGSKLVADLTHVPGKVKDLIELGAYATVSAEVYPAVQLMGKVWKNVLSALSFLGGEIPAIGTLDDALALYANARRFPADAQSVIATYTPARVARSKEEIMADKRSFGTALREAVGRLIAPRAHELGEDGSIEQRRRTIEGLLTAMWSPSWTYVQEMFDEYVIACRDSSYFQVPYSVASDGTVTLGEPITEVEQTWRPASDSSAPVPNTAGATGRKTKEADMAITKAIATALGLPETADEPAVLKAIAAKDEALAAAKADSAKFSARLDALESASKQEKAEKAVDAAITAKKILPATRDAMVKFAAADPETFQAFVDAAQPTAIDTTERGSGADAPEAKSEVAQFRAKVAEKVKAGMAIDEAQKAVSAEEPELFAAVYGRR